MRILITGANGFIGRNLRVHLAEAGEHDVIPFMRDQAETELVGLVAEADAVIHLAGVNRTEDAREFVAGNVDLTNALCEALDEAWQEGRRPRLIYASSAHAVRDTDYGRSKLGAETRIAASLVAQAGQAYVFRLPNVFGKWCRPNYNSAIATFCHNISHGLPVRIDDRSAMLRLVYIDDVVASFLQVLKGAEIPQDGDGFAAVVPEYQAQLGDIVDLLHAFRNSRDSHVVERVGAGLTRALYSTYLSYLEPTDFAYPIKAHRDPRGAFAEMLRTKDSGQVSFFTAGAGVTRGGHYHHSKNEKFLVIKGQARFKFRHIVSGRTHQLDTDDVELTIVETVPGWTHDITNIGDGEMLVLLWANEQFDPAQPDTYAMPLS